MELRRLLLNSSIVLPEGLSLPPEIAKRIPEKDRWGLTLETRIQTLENEIVRRHKLSEFLLKPENGAEREKFMARCQSDPAFFMENCIWSKDPERRMGLGLELPLIPYSYMTEGVSLKEGVEGGGWLKRWMKGLDRRPGEEIRLLEEKGRRILMSIFAMAFFVWGFRFYPGFDAWVSSDNDKAIDNGEDWNSLLGKFRFMYKMVHRYFPWMMPELAKKGDPKNKENYIEFADWKIGPRKIAEEVWGNKIQGFVPNDVAGRGGAALMGFIDEAGWINSLGEFLDSIEQMTPFLILASTPPSGAEHPFARRALGEFDYNISTAHWTMNPAMAEGIYWDAKGDYRGVYTENWRSLYYDSKLKNQPSHIIARNYDLDYRSTTGSRVFVSYDPTQTCGDSDPKAEDFDFYDQNWRLEIWVDVGRRDPWACLWVMISDMTGEIRIVDYWMRSDVTIEWWIPIWLGWNPHTMESWRTFPDYRQWRQSVPFPYNEEDLKLMQLWHKRFGSRPDTGEFTQFNSLRPQQVVIDMQARQRTPGTPRTVEQIAMQYGIPIRCVTTAHNMEASIDHAASVLMRTKIAGRIGNRHPESGGTRYPSLNECFLHWKWLDATERESHPKPSHDIYSHPMTAFIYGALGLPAKTDRPDGIHTLSEISLDKRGNGGYNRRSSRSTRHTGHHGATGIPSGGNW